MQLSRAQQPIAAAAVSLVVFCACIAAFLPPLNRHTLHTPALTILLGMTIAVSLILHLIFIGIAASRLARSPVLWVIIALCTMPIASIIGLILFEWFSDEQKQTEGLN
jgi:hypothetical protein